jgi:chromosome segregation ATPase
MTGDIARLLIRHTASMAMVFGLCLSTAFAQETEEDPAAHKGLDAASRPISEPLTDFEKMEVHHRRYSTAANNMAQLFKQLNQKIEEVSLAAKTAEAKDSSHNRRLLETKLHQMEGARASYITQYSQLWAQMQNEYRNYAALSNNLKIKHDAVKDARKQEEATKENKSQKTKPAKNRDSKAKDLKAKDSKVARNIKAKAPRTGELEAQDSPAKDPRVMDMDPVELRARRDGTKSPAPSSESNSGPALNIVR